MGVGRRPAGTLPADVRGQRGMQQLKGRGYELKQDGRTVYCNSPSVVSVLLTMGWSLSNPAQLAILNQELASISPRSTDGPSDHVC